VSLLAVCGLQREAALIASPEVTAAVGGGGRARLESILSQVGPAEAVISIGLAGALDPTLSPGDWVVASEVVGDGGTWPTDPRWTEALAARLTPRGLGRILGGDAMLLGAAEKQTARARWNALSVDMESHLAARAAARLGAPFAAIRVISDGAQRNLPAAVRVGLKPDGTMALGAILATLARDPRQLPGLIRTGREAGRAFQALGDGRRLLGPRIGLPDLGQLPLDVA
jgi:hopanoid-associated phosphorylase